MKLIRCRKCEDVVRLIETKWRTCECGNSGGQYNGDSVTATVGGDCDVVGLSNLFFDNKYRKLSDEEKEEYKKEINHHPCEVWFGELEGDKQIHRIKSSKGPRLKMDIDYIGNACVITFKDNRDYKVNLKGNKKPKKLIIPDANVKSSFKKDKMKENVEKRELRKLIRESFISLLKDENVLDAKLEEIKFSKYWEGDKNKFGPIKAKIDFWINDGEKYSDEIYDEWHSGEKEFILNIKGSASWSGGYKSSSLYSDEEYPEFDAYFELDPKVIEIKDNREQRELTLSKELHKEILDEIYRDAEENEDTPFKTNIRNTDYYRTMNKKVQASGNDMFENIIKESLGNVDNDYVTENVDADVYLKSGIGEDDYFTSGSKATIYWTLEIERKGYGIKTLYPLIQKIELDLEYWRESTESFEKIEKVFDNLLASDGTMIEGFKLKIEKNGETGHMFPTSIEINEDYKEIEITFDMP
jgi:hypothetical protein